ncbi:MAG: hypothetical protein QNI99_08000 [Woeseiaceae bacterium]|nr:hypothetical protein [Woeseiaceae bacterium]
MNSVTCDCGTLEEAAVKEARTDRSNHPVFYTGLWHLLIELFSGPATRMHRLKWLGARMLESSLREKEDRRCR